MAVRTTTALGGEEELLHQSTWHSFQIFQEKKRRLEQKSSQILFLKNCELSTISAAGFQQLLSIPFTHREKAKEQKAEDRVLWMHWHESKNYTEHKQRLRGKLVVHVMLIAHLLTTVQGWPSRQQSGESSTDWTGLGWREVDGLTKIVAQSTPSTI